MDLKQKDIVLLPFPFSDLEGQKVRPALVVSNDTFNKTSADCLMVPLTSVIIDEPYSIIITPKDVISGKLVKTSRIKTDKIFSVEKNLAIMKIGTANDEIFKKVRMEISKMM